MSSRNPVKARATLDAFVSVVMVGAACILVYQSLYGGTRRASRSLATPREPYSISDAHTRGSKDAEYVLVMFSDFECPYCRRFTREVLPEIERRYISNGRVLFAFQHFPLKNHPNAMPAAVRAECAGQQDRFWPMHDRLFEAPKLDEEEQAAIAGALGLKIDSFTKCVEQGDLAEAIEEQAEETRALGITGTPTFFLGKKLPDGRVDVRQALSGALSVEEFSARLDTLLSRWSWLRWS